MHPRIYGCHTSRSAAGSVRSSGPATQDRPRRTFEPRASCQRARSSVCQARARAARARLATTAHPAATLLAGCGAGHEAVSLRTGWAGGEGEREPPLRLQRPRPAPVKP
jgi:hypothetical protein